MTVRLGVFSAKHTSIGGKIVMRNHLLRAAYALWLIIVSGTVCLPKLTAQAQQLSSAHFSIHPRSIQNGWWCLGSRRTIAHLQVGTGDQIDLLNTVLISSTPETENYRPISLLDDPIGNHPVARLAPESRGVNPGSLAEAELLPETLLSSLQSKYTAWESRLEDSGPRTNVNGRLVYPLLQVNYGGWHLPISLYLPPLQGSATRR